MFVRVLVLTLIPFSVMEKLLLELESIGIKKEVDTKLVTRFS